MPISPLGTNLPLAQSPYNSRVTDSFGTENKNYYLVGFTPGFALQASELNEIQELFFVNQSLTLRQQNVWRTEGYDVPFWEGLVPYDPTQIEVSNISYNQGIGSVTVTVNPGWYLWTDFRDSKLTFWIQVNDTYTSTVSTESSNDEYIGLLISKNIITCCPAATCSQTQDSTLRDNSQGNAENFFTCGASRFKASVDEDPIRITTTVEPNSPTSKFYPILKVKADADQQKTTVAFYDGQQFIVQ